MTDHSSLQRTSLSRDGVRIFRISGRSRGVFAEKPVDRQALTDGLAAGERYFVFNVSDLRVLDSSVLGDLLACQKQAREAGGSVRVVLSASQRKLFRTVNLDSLVETFDSEDEAVAAARAEAAG